MFGEMLFSYFEQQFKQRWTVQYWTILNTVQYLLCSSFILEKAMAMHSSTLAWKSPWREEPGRLLSMGSLRVGHEWATSLTFHFPCIREGNGNPLQCSCLENPRDGGGWWAAIYGVTQGQTRPKWLSSSSSSFILSYFTLIQKSNEECIALIIFHNRNDFHATSKV